MANSQCDAIRTPRAVLRVPAAVVRFGRCEKSSSLPSTCWSPSRSSFAPAASAPSPPSPCYSGTSCSSVIAPGSGRPISLRPIASSSAWPRCSCARAACRSLARWSGRRHWSSSTRPGLPPASLTLGQGGRWPSGLACQLAFNFDRQRRPRSTILARCSLPILRVSRACSPVRLRHLFDLKSGQPAAPVHSRVVLIRIRS